MKRSRYVSGFVATAALLAFSGAAQAASPTQADFDACNTQAQAMASSPAASPGSGGQTGTMGSDSPKPGAGSMSGGTSVGGGASGTGSASGGVSASPSTSAGSDSDAQLQGISSAHAGDAAYKQAYRDCMKGRGF
jgi:hypothetical protein